MRDSRIALETLDAALAAVLGRERPAIVAALGADGFRVPLPPSFELGRHQALAVPEDRATILDVVVPQDRIAVVAAWERARENGIAVCPVRVLTDPERPLTLSMVDARERFGTWLAAITDEDGAGDGAASLLAGPLVVPLRPRLATVHKSMTAVITAVDGNVAKMFGWTAGDMVGERSTAFIHPDDHHRAVTSWMQLVSSGGSQRIRLRHRCADGGFMWVEVEHIHNGAVDPDEVDVVGHISDISDEMAAHEALHRREQLFSRLAESLPTGVLQIAPDRSVTYANARVAAVLGIERAASAGDLVATVADTDRAAVDAAIAAALGRGEDGEVEVAIRHAATGERRRCALTLAAVEAVDGDRGALICVSDVTESARLRAELELRATVDALTGCLNRAWGLGARGRLRAELELRATVDALTGCLNRASAMGALERFLAERDGRGTAVVYIDIDMFKAVNDELGHAAGDELLVHVGTRLRRLCRERDVVGRLGGDEFLLVCRDVDTEAQAIAIGARVQSALGAPVALSAGVVELHASVGVAGAAAGVSADALVARADAAMYEAKHGPAGGVVVAGA